MPENLQLVADSLKNQLADMELDGCVIILIKGDQSGGTFAGKAHVDNIIGVVIQFLANVRNKWAEAVKRNTSNDS